MRELLEKPIPDNYSEITTQRMLADILKDKGNRYNDFVHAIGKLQLQDQAQRFDQINSAEIASYLNIVLKDIDQVMEISSYGYMAISQIYLLTFFSLYQGAAYLITVNQDAQYYPTALKAYNKMKDIVSIVTQINPKMSELLYKQVGGIAQYHYVFAHCYNCNDDDENTEKEFEEAIKHPELPMDSKIVAFDLLAQINKKRGDFKNAQFYYTKIYQFRPNEPFLNTELAKLSLKNENLQFAAKYATLALRCGLDDKDEIKKMMEILVDDCIQNNSKLADEMLSNANSFPDLINPLIAKLLDEDRIMDAFALFGRIDNQDSNTKTRIADGLTRIKEYKTAKVLYEELLRELGDSFDLLQNLGVVSYQLGLYSSAIIFLRKALIYNPHNSYLTFLLGGANMVTGNTLRGVHNYMLSTSYGGEGAASSSYRLGMYYERLNDHETALRYYKLSSILGDLYEAEIAYDRLNRKLHSQAQDEEKSFDENDDEIISEETQKLETDAIVRQREIVRFKFSIGDEKHRERVRKAINDLSNQDGSMNEHVTVEGLESILKRIGFDLIRGGHHWKASPQKEFGSGSVIVSQEKSHSFVHIGSLKRLVKYLNKAL